MSDGPPEESIRISTATQYKALGHPLRQRLLFSLGQQSATISQLAGALGAQKGNVAHHLKVLREAGLVHVAETRQVRGGTEQYYQRVARRIELTGSTAAGQHGPATAMFSAVADDLASSTEEPTLSLRHLRLTAEQAERLGAALTDLVDEAADAGEGEARYGVLVTVYRPAQG